LTAPPQYIEVNGQLTPIVADSAFALHTRVMKGFPLDTIDEEVRRGYNYRIVRARRMIECAWGRLFGRWRVLHHNNISDPNKMTRIAYVCIAIHNWMQGKLEIWDEVALGKEPEVLTTSRARGRRHAGRASRAAEPATAAAVRRALEAWCLGQPGVRLYEAGEEGGEEEMEE